MIPVQHRNKVLRNRNAEIILKMCGGDESLAAKLVQAEIRQPQFVPTPDDLTVCITNFGRSKLLNFALVSCRDAGIKHVVVASMEPDEDVHSVINTWDIYRPGWLTWTHLNVDLGCNELWLQAVYRARTERVLVLHDDDWLIPEFGAAYRDFICPAMRNGAGFASWRGRMVHDDGKEESAQYFDRPTGMYPSSAIEAILLTDNRMSMSPILSVFNRSVLIDALKEAQANLNGPENYLHPTMLLGTEIIAYLRHCTAFANWFYLDQELSRYGAWEGSGTIKAQNEGQAMVLRHGYNLARRHFRENRTLPDRTDPRIIFVYNDYEPRTTDERRRMEFARSSWLPHFEAGTMLEFPIHDRELKRSSGDIGDPRPVPYVKDLIDFGVSVAMPNDIVVLANRDIILTTEAVSRIREGVIRGKGAAPAIRRNTVGRPPKAFLKSAKSCHPDTGFDLFAFTPRWWKDNADSMPDMLLGREAWDSVMRTLMDEKAGGETRMDDVFYHESHSSFWTAERVSNPGQLHNRALALQFFKRVGDKWMIQMLSVADPQQLFQLEAAKRATL